MDTDNRSRKVVKERLEQLEATFGSVTVNQTTFEVPDDQYRAAVEQARDGEIRIQAVVRNETDEVLLSEHDGGWALPRGRTSEGEAAETAVKRIVREDTAVDCTIENVTSATITGLCNSDDPSAETVYQLNVVFTAAITDATPGDDTVRWDAEPEVAGQEFV